MKIGAKSFAAFALLALLLCACVQETPAETQSGLSLWFPTARETLDSALDTCGYDGAETVPGLMQALLDGPDEGTTGLYAFAPAGTELLGWSVDGRVAQVELSTQYAALEGVDRTLADYCIALTLTQLDGVDGARIIVDGVGQGRVLRAGDVVFSGAEEEPVEVPAALYFRLGSGGRLGYELRSFRLTEDETPAKVVLEALIAGPEDAGLTALLPEELAVYSAWMDDGACFVDVSSLLLDTAPETIGEQELVIVSIVDTLCSLDGVDQVQIFVEGGPAEQYGEVDISGPLLPGTVE